MKRIALIGESPNDTDAIKHLLMQKYNEGFYFFPLLNNIKGSQLDSPKAETAFIREISLSNPNYIIIIRDSDANEHDNKTKAKQEWFKNLSSKTDKKSFFLLNIQAIEALILADIEAFGKYYDIVVQYTKNVMHEENPKRILKNKTANTRNQYKESDCKELFRLLKFDTIKNNCAYFKTFIADFEKAIEN